MKRKRRESDVKKNCFASGKVTYKNLFLFFSREYFRLLSVFVCVCFTSKIYKGLGVCISDIHTRKKRTTTKNECNFKQKFISLVRNCTATTR